jgi:dinuclear metal center YbgI/SA1388 family protein
MLQSIVQYLNDYLRIAEIPDYPNALNGLQLENEGDIFRIGAAVDASESVLTQAVERELNLVLVHHGLFWSGLSGITGPYFRKLKLALRNNLAVYSAHLPLDVHPEVGNNALLVRALDLPVSEPFLQQRGLEVGCRVSVDLERAELIGRVAAVVGQQPWCCLAGPENVRTIGIVTGAGGSMVGQAAREGVDTLITGEGPHHTFALAEELGLNLVYAGHYATETFGVRALAKQVAEKFQLAYEFLDHPSGL